MIATSISGATPVAPRTESPSACSVQNRAPAAMRASFTKIARYSYHGTTRSAGFEIASRIACSIVAERSVVVSAARSKPCSATILSTKALRAFAMFALSSACASPQNASPQNATSRPRGTRPLRRARALESSSLPWWSSVRRSWREKLPVTANRGEHTEAGQERHHRRAARAHERQRHTHDRQDPRDHARVDEHVEEERERQRAGEQPRERVLRLRRDPTGRARRARGRARASSRSPSSPNSSPITAKMKSVERSGRNSRCACVPFIQPLPNRPPEPIAIFDLDRVVARAERVRLRVRGT